MSSVSPFSPCSMCQFWLFHWQRGLRSTGMMPSSKERFQTERASRSAWFLTALGRAAVKSLVLASLPPSGSTSLSSACTSTLIRADGLLAVRSQEGRLLRRRREPDGYRGLALAHVLDCLSR